jgi:hypothetical protein
MQKVVGSSPIIRSPELPANDGSGKEKGRPEAAPFVSRSEMGQKLEHRATPNDRSPVAGTGVPAKGGPAIERSQSFA